MTEPNKLFVYGILKRGQCLDLREHGCKFIGPALLEGAQLYHIGSGVGLRPVEGGKCPHCKDDGYTNDDEYGDGCTCPEGPCCGKCDDLPVAHGEVFEILEDLWPWLDRIESNGFAYTRKVYTPIIRIGEGKDIVTPIDAWVYVHTYPGMKYEHPIESNNFEGEK